MARVFTTTKSTLEIDMIPGLTVTVNNGVMVVSGPLDDLRRFFKDGLDTVKTEMGL